MTNFNSNITNNCKLVQQNPIFKAVQPEMPVGEEYVQPEVQIPDMYYSPNAGEEPVSTVEKIKQVDMMGLVYPWLEHPILMGGTAAGLAIGVDKFSKACGGEYESSLVGKTAALGDKIANSEFVKSKPMQTTINGVRKAKLAISKFFKNSDLLCSIKNTPSAPEWAMVKDEMLSMQQRQVHEFNHLVSILKLTSDEAVTSNNLGIDKLEKEFIKKFFGDAKVNDKQISGAVQLKRLGWTDNAIKNVINEDESVHIVNPENINKLGSRIQL